MDKVRSKREENSVHLKLIIHPKPKIMFILLILFCHISCSLLDNIIMAQNVPYNYSDNTHMIKSSVNC